MKINPKSRLFEDISLEEGKEILYFVRNIIISDYVPIILPEFIQQWKEKFGYTEEHFLLILASSGMTELILKSIKENKNEF